MLRRTLLAGLAVGLLVGAGCRHFHRKRNCDPCDDARPSLGPAVTPRGEPSRIPPPSVPSSPTDALPPPDLSDRRESLRIDPTFPPAPKAGKSELLLPGEPPAGIKLEIPSERESPTRGYLEDPVAPSTTGDLPPAPAGSAPASLPGYATVPGHDGVASGRRPRVEGFDWLKANGYRTVVYLHALSEGTTAARELAEKRGLRFVPIAVTPATLRKALDEFTAAVGDRTARPVYVADEDGVRAGSLWYLVFRTTDALGDDAARLRANPLGLTDAGTEEQKQFWVAIQDVLAKR